MKRPARFPVVAAALLAALSLACNALAPEAGPGLFIPSSTPPPTLTAVPIDHVVAPATVIPLALASATAPPAAASPIPALPSATPPLVLLPGQYAVQPGDTVAALALRFRTNPAEIVVRNPFLAELSGGLTQTLPPDLILDLPTAGIPAHGFATALLPDSEVVYSPAAEAFDVRGFVLSQPGFLASYTEVLTDTQPAKPGWEIVAEYARRYSINPRLLLALLEHQSGALSNPAPDPYWRERPLLMDAPSLEPGLSHQLGWAGNQLNYGYYGWRSGAVLNFGLADGALRSADSRLNAGSFAVARLLGLLYRSDSFAHAASPDGWLATYQRLFGDPWSYAVPLIPGGLEQPAWQLPFEPGRAWAFTGGPHAPYGRTLPWGALDFAPPSEWPGCAPSPEWLVAVADGVVSYSHEGLLELNLGNGWTVTYLHIGTVDRVPAGTAVRAGQRLGHPSCEGGRASAVHVHLSRKFNGEWIAADGPVPFVLSGWTAHAGSAAYKGTLTNGERTIEACACAIASTRLWIEP